MKFKIKNACAALLLLMLFVVNNSTLLASDISENNVLNILLKSNIINYDFKRIDNETAVFDKLIGTNKASYEYCKDTDCLIMTNYIGDKTCELIKYINYVHNKNKIEEYSKMGNSVKKSNTHSISGYNKLLSRFNTVINEDLLRLIVKNSVIQMKNDYIVVTQNKFPKEVDSKYLLEEYDHPNSKVNLIKYEIKIKNGRIVSKTVIYTMKDPIGQQTRKQIISEYDYGKHYIKPFKIR